MNKTAIKNFAIWARNKLRADIILKAGLLGITDKEIANPLPQSTDDLQIFDIGTSQPVRLEGKTAIDQRKSLVAAIRAKNLKHTEAFDAVIEEVAYTWFNRLIAVRFMEVNDYLPSRVRVLSSENPAKAEPDFVTNPFDTDLDFTDGEINLIDNLKDNNKSDELFQFLFIKQCNKLNEILPELFEKTNDYTELLLNVSFTDKDGVVYHLVHDISEDDFNVEKHGQVEIIGWLYQYYNVDTFNQIYDGDMSRKKIDSTLLPAATQMFTPDWVVRYMTENSLGYVWLSGHKGSNLKKTFSYYVDDIEQTSETIKKIKEINNEYSKLKPEQIKCIDPCMGSGHILCCMFDILIKIYDECGFTERDAVDKILEYNLWGLDIDKRASQLAYFAVMMKARQHSRRFFKRHTKPHIYCIEESNDITRDDLNYLGGHLSYDDRNKALSYCNKVLDELTDAKEYGSILNVDDSDWDLLHEFACVNYEESQLSLDYYNALQISNKLQRLINVAKVLSQKYSVVVTNPPYLNSSRMSTKLNNYVKKHFPNSRNDLSMVMYEAITKNLAKKNTAISMVTTTSWMFISSFEGVRKEVIETLDFQSIVDFGTELFEGKIGHLPIVAWTNIKGHNGRRFTAIRLEEYCYANRDAKKTEFFNKQNYYEVDESWFEIIDGNPLCYWINTPQRIAFQSNNSLYSVSPPRTGMMTTNNKLFLRRWYEVDRHNISVSSSSIESSIDSGKRWFPYNKGGDFKKWYGNRELVVNWKCAGRDIAAAGMTSFRGKDFYFKEGLTWTIFGYDNFAVRYTPIGAIFDIGGTSTFPPHNLLYYILGFLNSKVASDFITLINPTVNIQNGDIKRLPFILDDENLDVVTTLVKDNIKLVKSNYDSFETSWDYLSDPLVALSDKSNIALSVDNYIELLLSNFTLLKKNEEKLNQIFAKIYGLQDTTITDISEKKVSIIVPTTKELIKNLISYAVGCMFGRYSLDIEGLAYAGGKWNSEKYKTFTPDEDNCIPITDTAYFEDDIVGRFCEFVKIVYGEDTLEANLEFIAKALGNKGNTTREIIRNYFLNDFFKDHCKIYQKCPIYWLFDSGKQNGFKALVYMHRWNADTIGNMRVEYLHRIQRTYEKEIEREQDTIDNTTNNRDRAAATKRKEKLLKQLKEAKDYDAKVAHLALSRPDIDLDDGVKVNYEKVQTAQDGKKLQILAKI